MFTHHAENQALDMGTLFTALIHTSLYLLSGGVFEMLNSEPQINTYVATGSPTRARNTLCLTTDNSQHVQCRKDL
jgi:hypothetical protein